MTLKNKIVTAGVTLATLLPALGASPAFAEGTTTSSTPVSEPAVELTAGKASDKDATVSKGEQALVDSSKKSDKESDKNTTVLKKDEPKKEAPKEEPKKEEPKKEEKVPEKLPEAGFENVGAMFLGGSAAGLASLGAAKLISKRKAK